MKITIAVLALFSLLALSTTDALAHGGRTDSCGGHNNRKTGGYHIHNYSKYCSCYPDSKTCDVDDEDDGKKDKEKEKKQGRE